MWKFLFWVVISSEKNWWFAYDDLSQAFHWCPAEHNAVKQQKSVQVCSMQQDPPARTMVLLLSAEGDKIQQLFTFVVSCRIEPRLGLMFSRQMTTFQTE